MNVLVIKTGDWGLAERIAQAFPRDIREALRTVVRQEAEDVRTAMVEGIIAQAPGGERFKALAASTLAFRRAQAAGGALAAGRKKIAGLRTKAAEKERGLTAARHAGMYVSRNKFGTAASRYQKLQSAIGRARVSTSGKAIAQAMRKGINDKALVGGGDLIGSIRAIHKGDTSFIGILRTAKTKDGKSLFNVARIHEFGGGPKAVRMSKKQRAFLHAMFRTIGTVKTAKGGGGVLTIRIPARPFVRPVFRALYGDDLTTMKRIAKRLVAALPLIPMP